MLPFFFFPDLQAVHTDRRGLRLPVLSFFELKKCFHYLTCLSFFPITSDKTRIQSCASWGGSLEVSPNWKFSEPLFHGAGFNKDISLMRFSPK